MLSIKSKKNPLNNLWIIVSFIVFKYLLLSVGSAYPEPKEGISPLAAQTEGISVSLKDAISMAIEHNQALKVNRLSPSIRQTFEDEQIAVFEPELSAETAHSKEQSKKESKSTTTAGNTKAEKTESEVKISKLFSTGTEASLGLTQARDWSDLYGDQHTIRAGLTVTQALLKGAGIKVNMASLEQARLDTFSSQYEVRGFAEALIYDVEKTYWDYTMAERQIEIFTESLKLAEQQLKETFDRVEVGTLAETELAAAQAEVALRNENLINARSDLAKIHLKLLKLLNPPGTNLWGKEVVLLDRPAIPEVILDDIEAHVEVALRMRPDLNQARLQVRQNDLEVVKTKNGLLPKMDFFITLGKTGYADSFGNALQDLDGESYDILAGLKLEYPLGSQKEKAEHKRASLSLKQAREAVDNMAQLIQIDVRTAYFEVNRTREQISATAATRRFQEEKLRAETEKFKVGKSTSLLVAQAQTDLVAGRISEIKAIVSYLNALGDLYRLEGSLLERRGISSPVFSVTHDK